MKYDGHGSLKYFKNVSLGGSTFCSVYCLQRHLFQQGQTIFCRNYSPRKFTQPFQIMQPKSTSKAISAQKILTLNGIMDGSITMLDGISQPKKLKKQQLWGFHFVD